MGKSFNALAVVLLSGVVGAGSAFAQSAAPTSIAPKPLADAGSGAAGFPMGPLMVFPGVDFAWGHDDNLFLTPVTPRETTVTILSPWVKIEGKPTPHSFDLFARADFGRYGSSDDDSYNDYQVIGNGRMEFSSRADLKVRAEAVHGHDPRGSTDRPVGAIPDEYNNNGVEGTFGYGGADARGRVEVNGGYYERTYTNNRTATAGSDRATGIGGGTFLWRVGARTNLLLQAERRTIHYELRTSTLDSEETRYFVGARWEATAATTGYAKFGRLKKDFDSVARQDFSGGAWDVGVRWHPVTYSAFDLSTGRSTAESTGVGDFIYTQNYGLAWTHAWGSRFSHNLFTNWREDEFKGVGVARTDEVGTVGGKVHYNFRRWLRFGLEYTRTERNSNTVGVDYTKNLVLFTIGATL